MKRKDIIIVAIVVVISATLAIIASNLFIKPADKRQQVEVVQAITPDFPAPDKRYFNEKSVNPTLSIQIGDNANPDPFRGAVGQ